MSFYVKNFITFVLYQPRPRALGSQQIISRLSNRDIKLGIKRVHPLLLNLKLIIKEVQQ